MTTSSRRRQRTIQATGLLVCIAAAGACADDGPLPSSRPAVNGEQWSIGQEDWTDQYAIESWSAESFEATDMRFLPDGRALVITKGGWDGAGTGTVVLISADGSTSSEILEVPVCGDAERGLIGLEVDPRFEQNATFYLFYTRQMSDCSIERVTGDQVPEKPVYNRLSAYSFSPSGVDPSSERVLLDELPGFPSAHNAGGMAFLADGSLLVGVGEAGYQRSREVDFIAGKVLRINVDTPELAPPDNPFYNPDSPGSNASLVWASGLRNPFRLAVDPLTDRVGVGEVGTDVYEELNLVVPGADYGYPQSEGPTPVDGVTLPALWYDHKSGCTSIIGGAWVPPGWVPGSQTSGYAFTDFGCGGVFVAFFDGDVASRVAMVGANIDHSLASVVLGPDGALYLVGIGPGPFPILRLERKAVQN